MSVAFQPRDPSYEPGEVARLVETALAGLGLDAARQGTADWNPLGSLVPPGCRILVKPNWVLHANEGPGGVDCLVTHPAFVREVLRWVDRARPRAVVIGDAPIQGCDFQALLRLGFGAVCETAAAGGLPLTVKDFRRTILEDGVAGGVVRDELHPSSDFRLLDLGRHSRLEPIAPDYRRFRVTMYDPRALRQHHRPGLHRYLVTREALEADLVVNLPKLKTHKKAGITAALKNLVGINGNKEFLPHHRRGGADAGGDNYPASTPLRSLIEALQDIAGRNLRHRRLSRAMYRLSERLLRQDHRWGGHADLEGGWYGNDTVWRMCLDLNKALLYATSDGALVPQPQRCVLTLCDGIVGGEGEGPLRPDPKPAGLVLAALNSAAHDWVAARLMGFQPDRLPIVARAFDPQDLPLTNYAADRIQCFLNGLPCERARLPHLAFTAPSGWRGHCELTLPAP